MYSNNEDTTIYEKLVDAVKKYPDNLAYEFMGEKCSYKDFLSKIDAVAKALISIGVKEDDLVCVSLPNIPQALYFIYAINKIGAVVDLVNCLSSENELLTHLNKTNGKVIIVIDQFYDRINNVKEKTSLEYIITTSIIDVFPTYKKAICKFWKSQSSHFKNSFLKMRTFRGFQGGTPRITELFAVPLFKKIGAYKPYKIDYKNNIQGKKITEKTYNDFTLINENINNLPTISDRTNKCAFILKSGGTTGKIKGVCLSNKNIIEATRQLKHATPKFLPGDKMLSIMPISHSNGLVAGIILILSNGGTCILMPRFTPKSYANALIKYKCNFISGVASIYDKVISYKLLKNKNLSFLKYAFCGADILPCNTEINVNNFFYSHKSEAKIRQGYGLTESVIASVINPEGKEKIGSIGVPLDGVDIKIIDPNTKKVLGENEIGEIVINSKTNMMGYYNDEQETKNVFLEIDNKSYIHTGDLGYVDNEGYLFFKDRIKNVIVKNGYNIFPTELENALLKCDIIKECCVIGVPDKITIEKVIAYIKLKDDYEKNDNSKQIILNHCKTNIAKYAIPKEIIFIDDFPKTRIGKIDFKILKEQYSQKR